MKWYNLRSVQQTLEEMQQRITSGLTPLPPLQIASALGPPARLTTTPGPSASGSHARPEIAKRPLVRKREKLNWRSPHSHGVMVVDPKASAWKTHRCPAGLNGRSGLMILILPTIGVRRTKTHLRTLMIPLSPLMGLSQVLPRPLWPPVPPVPPPKRPSDRWGVLLSVTPLPTASSHERTLSSYNVSHFISLSAIF